MTTDGEAETASIGRADRQPLPGDARRVRELSQLISAAFVQALRLFVLLLLCLFASGELQILSVQEAGANGIRFFSSSETLPIWIGGILCWDILLFALYRLLEPGTSIDEQLLSLGLSLSLWRLVLGNALLFLQPGSGTTIGEPTSWAAVLLFFITLVVGKEMIARTLLHHDRRMDSPLLAVWGWHHRKDAVFSLIFVISWWLQSRWVFSGMVITQGAAAIRLLLLGSATLEVTRRALRAIRYQTDEFCCSSDLPTGDPP